jgi:hypothetical protein
VNLAGCYRFDYSGMIDGRPLAILFASAGEWQGSGREFAGMADGEPSDPIDNLVFIGEAIGYAISACNPDARSDARIDSVAELPEGKVLWQRNAGESG